MNVSTAPKKSFGTYETMATGARKRRNCEEATKMPHARDRVPVRKVKRVCEKMYEPVKPPVTPESRLESPTVMSSWLKSSCRPMSIWIAATSSDEEKATTTYMASQVGKAPGTSSHRTCAKSNMSHTASGLPCGCCSATRPSCRVSSIEKPSAKTMA